jgi:hypothetical protein
MKSYALAMGGENTEVEDFISHTPKAVAARDAFWRAAKERPSPEVPSDFEREFSPHATYLEPTSAASTDYLVQSYLKFHAAVSDVIRNAAYEVVLAELGGK